MLSLEATLLRAQMLLVLFMALECHRQVFMMILQTLYVVICRSMLLLQRMNLSKFAWMVYQIKIRYI